MKTNWALILETGTQAKDVPHVDGVFFRCADCGKVKATSGNGCTTGYARFDGSDSLVCFACADERQREGLKARKPFCCYVSGDGSQIQTWTGGELGRVVSSSYMRLTRPSWVHGKFIRCIRARDVHGAFWFGRGSPGVAIKLRPCKG